MITRPGSMGILAMLGWYVGNLSFSETLESALGETGADALMGIGGLVVCGVVWHWAQKWFDKGD